MADACAVWLKVLDFAIDEPESGRRAAEVCGHASPLERAHYPAVRDKFVDDWRPAGGIELAMIEMLAQSFSLYLYWTRIAHRRAVEESDGMEKELKRFESQGWRSPTSPRPMPSGRRTGWRIATTGCSCACCAKRGTCPAT